MEYVTLGRTGIRVSVAGLGAGGFSRLGLRTGKTTAEAVALVRLALDVGVNFIDTAAVYVTETIIGEAVKAAPREQVGLATKSLTRDGRDQGTPDHILASLDQSLRQLDTDYVDVFQLPAVSPSAYPYARDVIVPALLKGKDKGKFRHLGTTEVPDSP